MDEALAAFVKPHVRTSVPSIRLHRHSHQSATYAAAHARNHGTHIETVVVSRPVSGDHRRFLLLLHTRQQRVPGELCRTHNSPSRCPPLRWRTLHMQHDRSLTRTLILQQGEPTRARSHNECKSRRADKQPRTRRTSLCIYYTRHGGRIGSARRTLPVRSIIDTSPLHRCPSWRHWLLPQELVRELVQERWTYCSHDGHHETFPSRPCQ